MSYPIYEVKPNSHIYRVASSLSREQCHDMVEFFDDQDDLHYDGITGGGYDTDVKITRDIAFEQLPAKGGIYKEIDDMLYNSLADGLAQL